MPSALHILELNLDLCSISYLRATENGTSSRLSLMFLFTTFLTVFLSRLGGKQRRCSRADSINDAQEGSASRFCAVHR